MSTTCQAELLRRVAVICLQVCLEKTVDLLFLKISLSFLYESGVIGPVSNGYHRQLPEADYQVGGIMVYPKPT